MIIGSDSAIFTIICEIDLKVKSIIGSEIVYAFTIAIVLCMHGLFLKNCYKELEAGWRKGTFLLLNIAFLGTIVAGLIVALQLSLDYDSKNP